MGVDLKHIATFLLGAAAGAGALKYSSMTDQEKEKLMQNLKDKANSLKDEASSTFDKAQDYFSELASKGSDSLKEHFPGASDFLKNLFGGKAEDTTTPPAPDTNATASATA